MRWMRKVSNRCKALFFNGKHERELDEEMRFHLDMEIEKNLALGMTQAEAKRTAQLAFGSIEKNKDDCRDSWGVRVVTDLVREIRTSLKLLWNNKLFSAAVCLNLGCLHRWQYGGSFPSWNLF